MSSQNNSTQKLNKKERRKQNRVALQQPQSQDNEENGINQNGTTIPTQNNHAQTTDPSLVTNGIQDLILEPTEQDGKEPSTIVPESETKSNGIIDETTAAAVAATTTTITGVITTEIQNGICSEEPVSCAASPQPPTARRRNIRIPITSAIPLLPPIEQKNDSIVKASSGKNGTPTEVYTNHFSVQIGPKLMLYQYDAIVEKLSFRSPNQWEEAMSRDQRRRFVQQLAENNAFDFTYWYDEGKCFYSTKNLNQRQFPLIYRLPDGNQDNFRLCIIKLAGQWSTATIFDYLRSPNTNNPPLSAIRILETLLKQALLPVTHFEGSLFYRDQSEPDKRLPDGFELRLGFFQALCLTQAGLTLNLQTTLTKFYPYTDILDFLSTNLRKDIRKVGMTSSDYEKARTVLNGCKITTKQSNYTQIYQIRSFSDIPERQTFLFTKDNNNSTDSSVEYNLIQYYKNEKNLELQYPKLRCLQCFFLHDRRDPKHIPIELCRILQWQECERESALEQRDRQNHSIPSPEQRYTDIMSSLQTCNYRSPPTLPLCKAVQLTVDDKEMKLIKARILPPPIINNNNAEINMGRINLKGRFVDPIKLRSVAFVYFGQQAPLPPNKKSLMEKFVDAFHKIAKQFRVGPIQTSIKDAVCISENDADRERNLQAIKNCFHKRSEQKCELVVCIMDSYWNELRPNIKLNGTVDYGIATQCLLYSKLQEQMDRFARTQKGSPDRILDNMCENLLRKINFKMQGTNTKVQLPIKTGNNQATASARPKDEDYWQFMGADVIHPVCRQDKPSIAAVVGSGDSVCSTSAVRVCKQWPRSGKCAIEAIVELQQMVRELLEYYQAGNDRLPNKIVFYRDGVDDGQFARILNFEIPQIKNAFQEVYQNEPLPLLTFIVVKKRHHTRFFILDNQNRTSNVPPGLVVDTDIVQPGQFSFFLNSHKALQGTNRPALYHVLYDEIQFTADELQLLTYYLCFTDPRSSTSEAIPSLIHQADLAASNARDLFPERDTSTNDGYAADALEDPSLGDIVTEHLRVHDNMRDTPHFG